MVRRLTEQVKSLALQDVYGRMARLLTEMSDPAGDERMVRHKLTQQDIADRVGSSREMVNRVMKELTAGRLRVAARRPARDPPQAAGGLVGGERRSTGQAPECVPASRRKRPWTRVADGVAARGAASHGSTVPGAPVRGSRRFSRTCLASVSCG